MYRITMACVCALVLSSCASDNNQQAKPAEEPPVGAGGPPMDFAVTVPDWAADTAWIGHRKKEQLANIENEQVFHDFGFTDQQPASGITFKHKVVNDASISYKAVHYDHGTGVAAADVDNDGDLDIYFPSQVGANELWLNSGDGTFEISPGNDAISLADRISVGASFADTDNDGDQDLFVTTVRGGNALFENDGTGKFTDISADAGVDYKGHSSGALFLDLNNDGLLDLYLANIGKYTSDKIGSDNAYVGFRDAFEGHTKEERTETSIVYLNEGGNKFVDASDSLGFGDTRWSGDIAPIDANGDGWTDVYVLSMQGLDGYYENQQGTGLTDKAAEVFPRTSWGAMGVQIFDFENDGDQDIYVTDMHSDMAEQVIPLLSEEKRKANLVSIPSFHQDNGNGIWGNSFFRNNGDGTFTEVSDDINAENFWPWGLSAGDLNADGFQDVFIASSMNYPWRYGINSVLLNDRGQKFVDAEFAVGVEPRRARAEGRDFLPWFELDCADADKGHKDCPKDINAGNVEIYGAYGSRSSVLLDLEGDGDLDIVTAEFGSEPLVLVNDLTDKVDVNSLAISLVGTKSNRNGLGATVVVSAGGSDYTQVMTGKSGYLGQSIIPLYFGLGESASVDAVEVRWPSGATQRLEGPIDVNRTIEVVESDS